jgi:hypothetical protein
MLIGCSVSYSFGDCGAIALYTSVDCSLSLALPLASLFLPLCQSRVLLDSTLCVACSLTLSIPLALTIHRQAHRRLQCIRPMLFACSFLSSFDDCTAVASALSTACSLSLSLASLFLPLCPTCCFLFVCRLLSFSFARSYSSSPSSSSSSMYSPNLTRRRERQQLTAQRERRLSHRRERRLAAGRELRPIHRRDHRLTYRQAE